MQAEVGFSREGKYIYKGIEFGTEVTRFHKFTLVKFTYEVEKNTYWHREDFTAPNWLDGMVNCKPVVWYYERKTKKLQEKLYQRALKTIAKKEGKL